MRLTAARCRWCPSCTCCCCAAGAPDGSGCGTWRGPAACPARGAQRHQAPQCKWPIVMLPTASQPAWLCLPGSPCAVHGLLHTHACVCTLLQVLVNSAGRAKLSDLGKCQPVLSLHPGSALQPAHSLPMAAVQDLQGSMKTPPSIPVRGQHCVLTCNCPTHAMIVQGSRLLCALHRAISGALPACALQTRLVKARFGTWRRSCSRALRTH